MAAAISHVQFQNSSFESDMRVVGKKLPLHAVGEIGVSSPLPLNERPSNSNMYRTSFMKSHLLSGFNVQNRFGNEMGNLSFVTSQTSMQLTPPKSDSYEEEDVPTYFWNSSHFPRVLTVTVRKCPNTPTSKTSGSTNLVWNPIVSHRKSNKMASMKPASLVSHPSRSPESAVKVNESVLKNPDEFDAKVNELKLRKLLAKSRAIVNEAKLKKSTESTIKVNELKSKKPVDSKDKITDTKSKNSVESNVKMNKSKPKKPNLSSSSPVKNTTQNAVVTQSHSNAIHQQNTGTNVKKRKKSQKKRKQLYLSKTSPVRPKEKISPKSESISDTDNPVNITHFTFQPLHEEKGDGLDINKTIPASSKSENDDANTSKEPKSQHKCIQTDIDACGPRLTKDFGYTDDIGYKIVKPRKKKRTKLKCYKGDNVSNLTAAGIKRNKSEEFFAAIQTVANFLADQNSDTTLRDKFKSPVKSSEERGDTCEAINKSPASASEGSSVQTLLDEIKAKLEHSKGKCAINHSKIDMVSHNDPNTVGSVFQRQDSTLLPKLTEPRGVPSGKSKKSSKDKSGKRTKKKVHKCLSDTSNLDTVLKCATDVLSKLPSNSREMKIRKNKKRSRSRTVDRRIHKFMNDWSGLANW